MRNRYLIYSFLVGYVLGALLGNVVMGVSVVRVMDASVAPGDAFNVSVMLHPDGYVKGWEMKILFDASRLQVVSVSSGDFYGEYLTLFNPGIINNTKGTVTDIYALIVGQTGNISDDGSVIILSFRAKDIVGTTVIGLYDVGITNETMYLPVSVVNGTVTVTTHVVEPDGQQPDVQPPDAEPVNNKQDESKPFDPMGLFVPVIFCLFIMAIVLKMFVFR